MRVDVIVVVVSVVVIVVVFVVDVALYMVAVVVVVATVVVAVVVVAVVVVAVVFAMDSGQWTACSTKHAAGNACLPLSHGPFSRSTPDDSFYGFALTIPCMVFREGHGQGTGASTLLMQRRLRQPSNTPRGTAGC